MFTHPTGKLPGHCGRSRWCSLESSRPANCGSRYGWLFKKLQQRPGVTAVLENMPGVCGQLQGRQGQKTHPVSQAADAQQFAGSQQSVCTIFLVIMQMCIIPCCVWWSCRPLVRPGKHMAPLHEERPWLRARHDHRGEPPCHTACWRKHCLCLKLAPSAQAAAAAAQPVLLPCRLGCAALQLLQAMLCQDGTLTLYLWHDGTNKLGGA